MVAQFYAGSPCASGGVEYVYVFSCLDTPWDGHDHVIFREFLRTEAVLEPRPQIAVTMKDARQCHSTSEMRVDMFKSNSYRGAKYIGNCNFHSGGNSGLSSSCTKTPFSSNVFLLAHRVLLAVTRPWRMYDSTSGGDDE